jgi:hypothetical protein
MLEVLKKFTLTERLALMEAVLHLLQPLTLSRRERGRNLGLHTHLGGF